MQHRDNAACSAALAAVGQTKDEPPPDDAAKARLRARALGWLNAERDVWARILDGTDSQARAQVSPMLLHWKSDTDLAGIRDADALARLPEAKAGAWRALWADVDALLKRAATPR